MSTQTILPDLQAAILCEDIRPEISGQQTVIGVLGVIPAPTVPIGFLKLCFWTRWCGGCGNFSERIVIIDAEEEKPIAETSIQFSLAHMNANATNVHFFSHLQFQRFGIYHIEVYLEQQLRLRIPLPVIKIDPPQKPPSLS